MRDIRYFEDFAVGDRFRTAGVTLTEAQILDFATVYDPQPIHTDIEAARKSPYGGLIASGYQTIALAFRLFYQERVINDACVGGPGMDEIRFFKPVRPGDTVHAEVEVIDARPSRSKGDRGYLRMLYRLLDQEDEPVMSYQIVHILLRRPADA